MDDQYLAVIRPLERKLVAAEQRRYRCRVALEAAEVNYNALLTTIEVLRDTYRREGNA